MYQHPEILKVGLECKICGTRWQFENVDAVAEKSIDHHYKSGECEKKYNENRNVSYGQFMQNLYQLSSGTQLGSGTLNQPTWTNPSRGHWHYY